MNRNTDDRGRHATRPREIPGSGWKDIGMRVYQQMTEDNLSLVSAGVAFYGMLAIFPALAAIVSIYGLVADPAQLQNQMSSLTQVMPQSTANLVNQQMQKLASTSGSALGIGLIVSIVLSVSSAMKGITALMAALNIVYDESEKRTTLKYYGWALALTVGAVLFVVVAAAAVVAIPAILNTISTLGVGPFVGSIINALRWPILAAAMVVAMAALYRYGPSRDLAQWRWISWGAVAAMVLWLLASAGFSYYVSHFNNYNATYGSLGSVVVLLMWLYVSAYAILLGAEIDSEVEHQTQVDTTEGRARRMGERGAHVADTVGRSADEKQQR